MLDRLGQRNPSIFDFVRFMSAHYWLLFGTGRREPDVTTMSPEYSECHHDTSVNSVSSYVGIAECYVNQWEVKEVWDVDS